MNRGASWMPDGVKETSDAEVTIVDASCRSQSESCRRAREEEG